MARSVEVIVTLTEEYIPGAMLDSKRLETYTAPELRWWLLCRGISLQESLKKAQVKSE